MKKINMIRNLITVLLMAHGLSAYAGGAVRSVNVTTCPVTGALTKIQVGDNPMNWVISSDGKQYPWVTGKYGWGLGHLKIDGQEYSWSKPVLSKSNGVATTSKKTTTYRTGDVDINVERISIPDVGDVLERYTFVNNGNTALSISDIGIYTPFNDNYPGAEESLTSRCHAHIWPGGEAAYVFAERMNGQGTHLGLMLTDGEITGYEIMERGRDKANSHFRGVIALNAPDVQLAPGEKYSVSWLLFSHKGKEDFINAILSRNGIYVESDKYVYEKGDVATIKLRSKKGAEVRSVLCDKLGDNRVPVEYDGKKTFVELLTVTNVENLISKRAEFILKNQKMRDKSDRRFGAFMVYDNEGDSIYPNNTRNCNPVDRDEGAERVGMGVFLAKYYKKHPSEELLAELTDYALFLRKRLQMPDYTTYSSVDKTGRNRGYNYVWVADYYFHLYDITKKKQYAIDGYETLKSWFRQFGYGFYAIGIPVELGLKCLKDAGLDKEYSTLLSDYRKTGDIFIANSLNYPAHEVNYEQSIVAPAVQFLAQMYIMTGDKKYLNEVEKQLPVLSAFNGIQPSHHLNDIAIRHWDGYWFGKREMFGDTFPHYWSTTTGAVYHYYARITGKTEYQERARNIVLNNLSLFDEDGRGYCAYLYPDKVDGAAGKFNDPYANDQDWALAYYYLINEQL